MTDLISLPFIAMIPINFKITNFPYTCYLMNRVGMHDTLIGAFWVRLSILGSSHYLLLALFHKHPFIHIYKSGRPEQSKLEDCFMKVSSESGRLERSKFGRLFYDKRVIPYQINKKKSSPSHISLKIGTHVGSIGKPHQTKF